MLVLNLPLPLPTKCGHALVYTDHLSLSQATFQCFFEELTLSLRTALLKYENLLIMGDFNIGVKSKSLGDDKHDEYLMSLS